MSDDNPMSGAFLGGGSLEYVITGGEVYLHAKQLFTIFGNAGLLGGAQAVQTNDSAGAAQAVLMLALAQQVDGLRSELLRQEAEKSLNAE